MALVVADRVKETTTTTGTGAITLAGAEVNFVAFSSVLSDGDTTYYAIVDDSNQDFEVGLGTYATSGNTLTRTTVLASSNGGSAVDLSAGSKEVFITYPAGKSVNKDASGNVSIPAQGDLRLEDASGGEYVGLQAPSTVASSFTLTLPSADGSANQLIKTDGSGNLSFTTVEAAPSTTATASGAIADGDLVVMNSNGTVSSVSGVKESISTPAQFETGSVIFNAVVYDANADRYVFAYEDSGNAQVGTAIVGQLNTSNDTWTFGTPVVFENALTAEMDIIYDPDTQRVVIAYIDDANNDYLTTIVGQVDNTDNSISFGTPVIAASEDANYPRIDYDTDQNRVVLAWWYTYPKAIAGSVTGGATNSISYGSAVNVVESSNRAPIGLAFDSNSNKHLYVYGATQNNSSMNAGLLSLSGSTITVEDTLTIYSPAAQTAGRGTTVFDSNVNKFVSFFKDISTNGCAVVVCSVSGTEIVVESSHVANFNPSSYMKAAFDSNSNTIALSNAEGIAGSPSGNLAIHTGNIGSDGVFRFREKVTRVDSQDLTPTYTSMCFDSTNNLFVVAFADRGTSPNPGMAAVYRAPSGNLTEGNFLGISNGAYSDTTTATIQLVGSVDDAQSGLTAGQEYYVLADGSLSTDSKEYPNVRVGVATSATQIVIKG